MPSIAEGFKRRIEGQLCSKSAQAGLTKRLQAATEGMGPRQAVGDPELLGSLIHGHQQLARGLLVNHAAEKMVNYNQIIADFAVIPTFSHPARSTC